MHFINTIWIHTYSSINRKQEKNRVKREYVWKKERLKNIERTQREKEKGEYWSIKKL